MKTRIRFLLPLLLLCTALFAMALCTSAETVTGSCGDNLTYTLDTDTGELSITGTGEMWDFSYDHNVPWHYCCSEIYVVKIAKGVTSIERSAFKGCSSLTSITIPDGVTSIGGETFYGCSNLTSITIPNGVTSIKGLAFKGCSSLTSITIPESVTSIEAWAFDGCSSLTSITIPNGVTSIEGGTFSGCSSLTSITIPDGVTNIGQSAFYGCSSLTSITIPDGVTSIGEWAFRNCSSLTNVTIPDGVTSIGGEAFYGCSNLTSITIPGSVTEIGVKAFAWCKKLICIEVAAGNPNYCSVGGVLFNKDKTVLMQAPGVLAGAYTVPESVRRIDDSAFAYCNITSITIPQNMTEIGAGAFTNTRISSVNIDDLAAWCAIDFGGTYSNPVYSAGNSATALYQEGSLVTQVQIPADWTKISAYALSGFQSITQISVAADNPGYASEGGVLYNKDKTVLLTVPAGMTGTYAAPASVTTVENFACVNSGLTAVRLPGGVQTVGNSAFYRCKMLSTVTLSEGLTSIRSTAFYGCSSLTEIALPESLTNIDSSAFGSSGLRSVVVPANVKSLGSQVFDYCKNLTSITILNPTCDLSHFSFYGKAPEYASATATIYGYNGSTAEEYVKKYDRVFVSLDEQPHVHSYSPTFTIDVPATCAAVGSKSRHCTVEGCDARTDITEIPKNDNHDFSAAWTVDVPATCAPGEKSHHCTRCDARTDVTRTPATEPHQYENGVCTVCGKAEGAFTPGDINDDGVLDIADVLYTLSAVLNGKSPERADINGDGKVNLADIICMLRKMAE